MGQRRTQKRRTGRKRRDARHHLNTQAVLFAGITGNFFKCQHFQNQTGHGVDACITTGNQGTGVAVKGGINGGLNPIHLLGHACGQNLLVLDHIFDQFKIGLVPHHNIAGCQHLAGPAGHVVRLSGSCTYDIKGISARRVTVRPAVFGVNRLVRPVAGMAAASHALFTPNLQIQHGNIYLKAAARSQRML